MRTATNSSIVRLTAWARSGGFLEGHQCFRDWQANIRRRQAATRRAILRQFAAGLGVTEVGFEGERTHRYPGVGLDVLRSPDDLSDLLVDRLSGLSGFMIEF